MDKKKKEFKLAYKKVTAEREGIMVDVGNVETDFRFLYLSADDHIRLIRELQESLLRRSMYDGFMREAKTW